MPKLRQLAVMGLICLLLAVGCSKPAPSLQVTHQVEGRNVRLQIDARGPGMWTETHPHLTIDDGPEVMIYSPVYVVRDLTPGKHRIRVYLSDGNHRPIGVEQIIEVEVQE